MNTDKIFKLAKGFRGRAKNVRSIARERVEKAMEHSYIARRDRKRHVRTLWITKINAGVKQYDLSYGRFINGLALADIKLDRKSIANLASAEPFSFRALVLKVKDTLLKATVREVWLALMEMESTLETPSQTSAFSVPTPQLPRGGVAPKAQRYEDGKKPKNASGKYNTPVESARPLVNKI